MADEQSDRRKLLKIAGGCTIIGVLDGASLRSPREDAEASRSGLNYRNRSVRPRLTSDLMWLLRLSPVRIQGLIMMLQLGTPAAASAASAW